MLRQRLWIVWPLLAMLLLLSACAPATAPQIRMQVAPTPTPDPWTQAITQAQTILEASDLDAHFAFYQETGAQIDGYLAQLEAIRPALQVIDKLKQTELPVVGNAWDLLIRALDKAFLGSGTALDQLDQQLNNLLATHYRLQRLDELEATQTAIQTFQAQPAPDTLQAMGQSMAQADFILAGVDKDAASLQDQVDALLATVDKIQSGLGLVHGLAPQLQTVVQDLLQFIDRLVNPLRGLADTLETLRTYIAEDREIFWQIQDTIHQAQEATP